MKGRPLSGRGLSGRKLGGYGISTRGRGGGGASDFVPPPSIQLSGLSIAEDAVGDTEIGTASVANAPEGVTYTWAITSDPDSKFAIDETTGVLTLATLATLDYETATSHQVTIEATPSAGVPPPPREFTISVTNVIEAPVNVTPPAVTGALEVGGSLLCSNGTWTDMGAGSFAYQWKDAADDSDIDGATANTLLLTHALIDLNLYCEVTATNAADSTGEPSNTVGPVVDTTAPTLSSASGSGTGYTTGSAGVSTNEGNGTLYVSVTTSATQPSASQIKAGQNHSGAAATFADDATVSATGAQTPFSVTGLTHTTDYWAHFMHEDAQGNQSAVVTASFETDAATVPDAFEAGDWSIAAGDEEADVTISSLPADGGDTITDIEYRLDGGSWVSSGGTTSFTISSLTNDQEYDVELRAVNSVGAGAASDTKQVTPEGGALTFEAAVIALLGAKLRAFWLYDDPATMFQSSGGTGAVSSDTDPIGYLTDLSGNGKHKLQATSGNRPAFRTSPNRTRFDAVNDYLSVASAAFPIDTFEIFTVLEQYTAQPADWSTFTTFGSSTGDSGTRTDGFVIHLGQGNTLVWAQASEISISQSGSGNLSKGLLEYRQEASLGTLLFNGSSLGTDSSFSARTSPHSGAYVSGAGWNGGGPWRYAPVDKYCEIITAPLTSGERSALRDLINGRYSLW
jgi:hypothetical protein